LRRNDYSVEDSSGVGVIDKAALLLSHLENGPSSLSNLVAATGISRPTAHRLASALIVHRIIARDDEGRYCLGPRLTELSRAANGDTLAVLAASILTQLCEVTGESAQLFDRQGDVRRCLAAVDRSEGLRDTVPVGSELSMRAGSAAQVLMAWLPQATRAELLVGARFCSTDVAVVRERGWAHSVGQRETGVCSVSAPVFAGVAFHRSDESRIPVAAISVSGPIQRMTADPGSLHAESVVRAAAQLSALLSP
jgi:DNA-binding IclR family transcriptional regulator